MAFSITVTSPMKGAERISRSLGVYAGKVSITSYSQTLVECTAITKYFVPTGNATTGGFKDGLCSVVIDGPSDSGYGIRWDQGTGGFRCFYPTIVASTTISIPVDSNVGAGAALLFASGGGAGALHATSAVGNITYAQAAVSAAASEAAANVTIGTFGFVAVGFVNA